MTPGDGIELVLGARTSGEVDADEVRRLFADGFDRIRERAAATARDWLEDAVAQLGLRRRQQADLLRRDLAVDIADRLHEIDEEERAVHHPVGAGGQQRLFPTQQARGGFQARRAAIEAAAEQREAELAAFEKVEPPASPRPLGALFLLPLETGS